MESKNLVARAKGMLFNPKAEWPVIAAEPATAGDIFKGYVVILAALGPIAIAIKTALFGVQIPLLGTLRPGMPSILGQLVLGYVMSIVMTWVVAWLVDTLAPTFGGQRDRTQALKTVAYGWTPVWVAGILNIVPGFGFLAGLAGLAAAIYSIYLLIIGLPYTMKSPPDRSKGYAAAVILIAIVLSMVVGGLTAYATGMSGLPSGTTVDDNSLSSLGTQADPASPLGKLEAWGAKMEQAGKKMEAAEKSGDADAQSKAFGELMGTVMGGGDQVTALEPERLKPFLPETLGELTRGDFSVERNGALGMQVAVAQATYSDDQGRDVRIAITDMGSAKGMLALAGWATLEQDRETEDGYERTRKRDGRLIHEKWNKTSGSGEYGVIVGDRFSVQASGSGDGIERLKKVVESLDLSGLEALKKEGVKKAG